MVQTTVKRHADPQIVLLLWNGAESIKRQKQIATHEQLKHFVAREYGIKETECDRQIQNAVQDGLMKPLKRKGSVEEGLRMPEIEDPVERDSHDWYCFDCHQAGEVMPCSECWRVYHTTCTEEDVSGDTFTCSVCTTLKAQQKVKRKELNKMLTFTIKAMKAKAKEFQRFERKEEEMRLDHLAFRYMDLSTMDQKCKDRKYKSLEHFYNDARIVLHNVFLCYGDNSPFGALAKWMIRDTKYDLDEIRQCKSCYYYSNAKPKDWFAQPCRPPHELVFAKQKGFSYWPAKVIKVTKEGYDVRFFGGWHQRAVLPQSAIKPIDTPQKSLGIKKSAGFSKAMEELKRHQALLEDLDEEDSNLVIDEDEEEEGDNMECETEDEPAPIKHKKFRKRQREEETTVTSSSLSQANVSAAEDLVTSTEQDQSPPAKKSKKKKSRQSVGEASGTPSSTTTCSCGVNVQQALSSLRAELEAKHRQDKAKALREKEHQLKKEFEMEKSDWNSRENSIEDFDAGRVRRETEEKCKELYTEDIKKLALKHKNDLSQTKRKQWCYNCDEEAMYHCCWNTSYCSIKCQQDHWHREHRRMCRRKR